MSQTNNRPNLRIFLFSVCRMIKDRKTETCACIEEHLSTGIATYLYGRYRYAFERYDFNLEHLAPIDDYYRNQVDPVDGRADRRYDCQETDGLWLVLQLALNEIY